jgi:hypothetical protein
MLDTVDAALAKAMIEEAAEADADGDRLTVGLTQYSGAHALLRAVYLNPDQPLSRRIRCAIAALPYEVPKLAVSSGGGGRDFAAQLEAARKRSGKGLVIEHQPQPKAQGTEGATELAPEVLEPTGR